MRGTSQRAWQAYRAVVTDGRARRAAAERTECADARSRAGRAGRRSSAISRGEQDERSARYRGEARMGLVRTRCLRPIPTGRPDRHGRRSLQSSVRPSPRAEARPLLHRAFVARSRAPERRLQRPKGQERQRGCRTSAQEQLQPRLARPERRRTRRWRSGRASSRCQSLKTIALDQRAPD